MKNGLLALLALLLAACGAANSADSVAFDIQGGWDSSCVGDAASIPSTASDTAEFVPDALPCDPNCAGRECGFDPDCGQSCGLCDGENEYCDEGRCVSCVPDCTDRECGQAPNCPGATCGSCDVDEECNDNGLCESSLTVRPFGNSCRQDATCHYDSPDYPSCADAMCESGLCWSFHTGFDFCTRACALGKDEVSDWSGEPDPDGVEDLDVLHSSCADATQHLFASPFRCVSLTAPTDRSAPIAYCLPGSDFRPCSANAECPDGETCQPATIAGVTNAFCLARPKGASVVTQSCNHDPAEGNFVLCETGLCQDSGCTGFCSSHEDCFSFAQGCDATSKTCIDDPQRPCSADADCSAYLCQANRRAFARGPDAYALCEARSCFTNSDCRDSDFFCALDFSATADPEDFAWEPRCRRRSTDAVDVGMACSDTPEAQEAERCHTELCLNGECSALCRSHQDCSVATGQRCILGTRPVSLDGEAPEFRAVVGLCRTLEGSGPEAGSCLTNDDCPDGLSCARYITGDYPNGFAEAQVDGLCRNDEPDAAGYGNRCGLSDSHACQGEGPISLCLDSTFDAGTQHAGYCSHPCRSSSDCAPMPFEEANATATVLPAYCQWRQVGGQGSADLNDDLYDGFCVPAPMGSTLEDCADTLECNDRSEGQICTPVPAATGGHVAYLCMMPSAPLDTLQPLGGACRADIDCASGVCLAPVESMPGYCSGPCHDDEDCPEADLVCEPQVAIDLRSTGQDALVSLCVRVGPCLPCENDEDCGGGYLCSHQHNAEGVRGFCAPPCERDENCAFLGNEESRCEPAVGNDGHALEHSVCSVDC